MTAAHLRTGASAGLATAILLAGSAFAGASSISIEVLFKSGDLLIPPPGFPAGGVVWNSSSTFSSVSIDASGKVAFVGRLFDNDIDTDPLILAGGSGIVGNDRVVYYGEPGNWTNVAQSGTPDVLPGGPAGFTFNSATGSNGLNTSTPSLSPGGTLVVSGTMNYDGVTTATDTGMWVGPVGSMTFAAQEGTHAGDEVGDVNYSSSLSISTPMQNSTGTYIFHSNLTGADVVPPDAANGVTGSNMGVFIANASGVTTFARRSDPAPAHPLVPDDAILNTQDTFGFQINGLGHAIYGCRLADDATPGAITTDRDRCVLTNMSGSLDYALLEGDAVPGMTGVVWGPNATGSPFNLATQGFNNSDQILFNGTFSGRGIGTDNDYAVFVRNADGSMIKVIQEGDPIGDTGSTFKFVNNTNFVLNNNGWVALACSITGDTTTDECLLVGPAGGSLTMLFREGDPVPGLTDVFFGAFISNGSLNLNGANEVAFTCTLTGAGTTTADNSAIFVWSESEGLRIVVRKGDSTVLGGDVITLATLGGQRNGECGGLMFNDSGWMTLSFSYSGGSAIARVNTHAGPACSTDLDGDGQTGPADLALLLGAWGPNPGNPADLTGDGMVGPDDLALLLGGWGDC